MRRQVSDDGWHQFSVEILSGMREWRVQHPKATLRDIETELDTRWYRVRARMVEDMALQSAATTWQTRPLSEHPVCPHCAIPLEARGTHPRHLQTHGGYDLALERSYGVCPSCTAGLFPPR